MKDSTSTNDKDMNKADMLKEAIMKEMECTEMEYCEFQYEEGERYLEAYCPTVPCDFKSILAGSRLFWNWWKMHWMARDEIYLDVVSGKLKMGNRRLIYAHMHDGVVLAEQISPDAAVYADTYAQLMHGVVKEVVK